MSTTAPWAVRRGLASVQLLVALAQEHGCDPAACLAGSGIAPSMLADPHLEIEAHRELVVVRNLVRRLRDVPGLGLEAGRRYRLTTYGIWGYALLSSRTLRSAVELAMRYLDLTFAFAHFRVESGGREVRLLLDETAIPPDCARFLLERDAAAAVALHRDLFLEPVPLRRVGFRFPRPPYAERFAACFAGPVRFDQPVNEIVIDAAWADRPLPQANEHTARLCEEACRALLARRRTPPRVSDVVRRHLVRPGQAMSAPAVARALGIAPRTLHRRLVAEGTTFRRLLAEVRRTLAEEMLAQRLAVGEVAERLGYAESASFIHAFKRWTGVSPGARRAQA